MPLSLVREWVGSRPQPIWLKQVSASWSWRETPISVGQPMSITGRDLPFPWDPLGSAIQALFKILLKDLGVGEDLKFSRVHYRIRAFGLDLPLSLPFSELVRELAKSFPTDAKAVEHFFKDMDELISKQKADPNRSKLNQTHNISASEYLHRSDQRLEAPTYSGKYWHKGALQWPSPSCSHVESHEP